MERLTSDGEVEIVMDQNTQSLFMKVKILFNVKQADLKANV